MAEQQNRQEDRQDEGMGAELRAGQGEAPATARPDLGFGAELDAFDPADWQPRRPARQPAAGQKAAAAAEKAGFRSREPAPSAKPSRTKAETGAAATSAKPARKTPRAETAPPPPQARPQRRRRTGRNAQFNIKARPETIEAFCAIADAHGWGLGETLERAVALMQESWSEATPDASGKGPGATGKGA